MIKKNLITQMIYRIILCCVSALAVLLTFKIFYVGEGPSNLSFEFLKFYTNISNYFVFVVSVIVLHDNVKRVYRGEKEGSNQKIRTLKFMTTVMILVTFLVYVILLGNPFSIDFWRSLSNISCHVFAPILFILDYFLFEEKKSISVFAPLYSLIIPLIYVVYIFILGVTIKDFVYPYFFLDVNKLGYGGVLIWVLILVVVFTILGYLLWLYNRLVKVNGKLVIDFKDVKLNNKKSNKNLEKMNKTTEENNQVTEENNTTIKENNFDEKNNTTIEQNKITAEENSTVSEEKLKNNQNDKSKKDKKAIKNDINVKQKSKEKMLKYKNEKSKKSEKNKNNINNLKN